MTEAEMKDQAAESRKVEVGVVVSAKRQKTITVELRRLVRHRRYGKYLSRSTLCHAHDEKNEARRGDRVEIQGTRPLSKQKRWRLVRILERNVLVDEPELKEVVVGRENSAAAAPQAGAEGAAGAGQGQKGRPS